MCMLTRGVDFPSVYDFSIYIFWYCSHANSGQFSYPLPNMVHPLESSVRTGAGNCPEFGSHGVLFLFFILLYRQSDRVHQNQVRVLVNITSLIITQLVFYYKFRCMIYMYCIVLYAFKSLYCTIVLNKLVIGDLSRFFWLSCLCPLVLLVPKHL